MRPPWITQSKDETGGITYYPDKPEDVADWPKCSMGNHPVQFLHFYSAVLPYLKDDEIVPSFCSVECALVWLEIKTGKKWEEVDGKRV